jgi:DNA-directed RNA polymerase specialized sigma24 family protein
MGATVAEIERVYRRDFDRLLRVAATVAGDEDVAYDVVQEAFARALRHRRGFKGRGPVEAWLWRTVVNAARAAARHERPVADLAANGGAPDLAPGVRPLVAALPERQRLALFLRYYADLDYDAIADVMGVSPGTVGAALNAARATLRERLVEVQR